MGGHTIHGKQVGNIGFGLMGKHPLKHCPRPNRV
jgi:hypothetical protein